MCIVSSPNLSILRRRVAWCIGQWIGVNAGKAVRANVYQVLLTLMSDSDTLVRLTAVSSLKTCVDDWDFEVEVFSPYFAQTVGLFTRLVADCEEFENKIKVLQCLGVIVERLESGIIPFAGTIVEILPPLWDGCGDQHMFRSAIVSILRSLVVV